MCAAGTIVLGRTGPTLRLSCPGPRMNGLKMPWSQGVPSPPCHDASNLQSCQFVMKLNHYTAESWVMLES